MELDSECRMCLVLERHDRPVIRFCCDDELRR